MLPSQRRSLPASEVIVPSRRPGKGEQTQHPDQWVSCGRRCGDVCARLVRRRARRALERRRRLTTPSAGGTITNTVNVTSREFDPDTADNIETIETTVSDFAIGVSPDNATVTRGQSASYTVTVTPQFGPFGNSIALACSNLPALASCMSSPRSLTPNSSSVTSTVTVSTTAPSAFLTPPFGPRDDAPFYALWLGLPGLAVVGLALAGQKPKKVKPGFYLSLSLLLALLVLQVACGGGGATTSSQPPPRPGTPTGTFNITITGTAGSLQHSTTATLVVQ